MLVSQNLNTNYDFPKIANRKSIEMFQHPTHREVTRRCGCRAYRDAAMETPASLSNSAAAAMIIQRAFRDAQKRIAADHVDLTAILNSLEEAEEHRINARTGVMTRVEKNLESSGAGFGIASTSL